MFCLFQKRSSWLEVLPGDGPHFAEERLVKIKAFEELTQLAASSTQSANELKFEYSFANSQFLVPWITLSDGKTNYLYRLTIEFLYSQANGGKIVGIRYSPLYHDSTTAASLEEMKENQFVHFVWTLSQDSQPQSAMNQGVIIALIGMFVMIWAVSRDVSSLNSSLTVGSKKREYSSTQPQTQNEQQRNDQSFAQRMKEI